MAAQGMRCTVLDMQYKGPSFGEYVGSWRSWDKAQIKSRSIDGKVSRGLQPRKGRHYSNVMKKKTLNRDG
eukprot:123288-Amphidinium_carterae.2